MANYITLYQYIYIILSYPSIHRSIYFVMWRYNIGELLINISASYNTFPLAKFTLEQYFMIPDFFEDIPWRMLFR